MATGSVVSATTRQGRGVNKRDRFLRSAQELVVAAHQALQEGDTAEALETSYQAALRTAGARIAGSERLAKRKRLPSSAWDRLALVDEAGAEQAHRFSRYSRVRSRVNSGIDSSPSADMVAELLRNVEQFLMDAEIEAGWHYVAA